MAIIPLPSKSGVNKTAKTTSGLPILNIPVSNVKTITLPDGGQFNIDLGDISKNPVKTTRGYAGLEAQSEAQRDHIIAVALGGTSNPENLKIQGEKAAVFKDNVEKYYINQYKSGKVNLNQAVVKIKNWDNEDLPNQKAYNKTVINAGGGLMTPTEVKDLLMDRVAQTSIGKKVLEWASGKVQAPAEAFVKSELEIAAEQGQRGIISDLKMAGQKAFEAPGEAIVAYETAVDNMWETMFSKKTKAEKLASIAESAVGGAGVLLSPISSVFGAAEELPGLRQGAQLFSLPFMAIGGVADFSSDTFIQGLVQTNLINQETADQLKPAFGQLASTTAQILLGAKVMDALNVGMKNTKDVFKSSDVLTGERIRVMMKEAQTGINIPESAKIKVTELPKVAELKLTVPEQKVVDLRNKYLTLEQTGKKLGYTTEKVRQLETKARTKLGETETYQVGITSVKGAIWQPVDKLVNMAKKMEAKGNYVGAEKTYFKAIDSGVEAIKSVIPSEGVQITTIKKSFGRYFGKTEPTIYLKVSVKKGSINQFLNGLADLADKKFKQKSVIVSKWVDETITPRIVDEAAGLSYEPTIDIYFKRKVSLKQAKTLDELFKKNNLAGATVKPDGSGIELINLSAYEKNYGQFKSNTQNLVKDLVDRGLYRGFESGIKEVRHFGREGQALTTYGRIRGGIETFGGEAGGRTTKVALSVQAKAIEEGFIKKGYRELAEYDPVTIADQARRTADLMTSDIESAKRIALGQEVPPEGLKTVSVFSAVEDYAMATKDGALVRDLAKSPIATEISKAGQTLRLAGERTPDSAVAKVKELQTVREKVAERKMEGKSANEAKIELKKQLVEKVKKAKTSKYDWNSFISEIAC